jgi:hypothetical protein
VASQRRPEPTPRPPIPRASYARIRATRPDTQENGLGFLAWDPAKQLSPPGQSDAKELGLSLQALVVGDRQSGCSYESQNEAWYRLLVDPAPYANIFLSNNQVLTEGMDTVLLAQRKADPEPDRLLGNARPELRLHRRPSGQPPLRTESERRDEVHPPGAR